MITAQTLGQLTSSKLVHLPKYCKISIIFLSHWHGYGRASELQGSEVHHLLFNKTMLPLRFDLGSQNKQIGFFLTNEHETMQHFY